jgi:hypothetical protein
MFHSKVSSVTVPAGTTIWPVRGVGKLSLNNLLPERVWCDGKKLLTQDVTLHVCLTVPNTSKFSKFNRSPDDFLMGYFKNPVTMGKTQVWGFIYPKKAAFIHGELSIPITEHSMLVTSEGEEEDFPIEQNFDSWLSAGESN